MTAVKKISQNQFPFKSICNIYTVRNLARILGESEKELIKLSTVADNFYRPFQQKQKNKIRDIDNPIREIKHIQGKINNRLLVKYPLPKEIFGGRKKFSIKDCAIVHVNQPVIVKLDLADCYPNVSDQQIGLMFRKEFKYSKKVALILTKLCSYQKHLPQGGRHSNSLLNILVAPLSLELAQYCKKSDFKLSFWVDDIAISGKNVEKHIQTFIYIINKHGFKINPSKIKVLRNNKPQEFVGCGVNKKISVPKKRRLKYKTEIWKNILNETKDGGIKGKIAHIDFINRNQAKELKKLSKKLKQFSLPGSKSK